MYDFQRELQGLNVGDFQAYDAVPWDQNQYYDDSSRQFIGIGSCFGFGFGFGCFRCFSCFGCGGCFRCGGCGGCGGRCGGCGRCGGRCR